MPNLILAFLKNKNETLRNILSLKTNSKQHRFAFIPESISDYITFRQVF